MQHQIYPDRFNDDGEFVPAVIVEVPDIFYLQVVDTDDCEDWPAPSEPDERTHCDERINDSDVAYVPLARAERAEAERDALRAQLDAAAFRTDGRPSAAGVLAEVLIPAAWEPSPVPGQPGRWRDQRHDTVPYVLGWRPRCAPGDGGEEVK